MQCFFGGGERVRTDDLLRARQALSQLSYTPEKTAQKWWAWMDLNHRPHAYQACALTKLSYRPSHNPTSLSAFLVIKRALLDRSKLNSDRLRLDLVVSF